MGDDRRALELKLKMLQLKKDRALAMQTAPVEEAATPEPPVVEEESTYEPLYSREPTTTPDNWDKAAHIATGATEIPFLMGNIPSMSGDIMSWGLDKATGAMDSYGIGKEKGLSKTLKKGMEGLSDIADSVPKYTDLPVVSEAYNLAASPVVAKGVSDVADYGKIGLGWAAGAPFAASKGASVLPDVAMGVSAMGGSFLDKYFGSDENGVAGEMAGGFLGMLASMLRGRMPVPKAERQASDYIDAKMKDVPDANKTLDESLANATKAEKANMTFGDATQSEKGYAIENTVGKQDDSIRATIRAQVEASEAARQAQIGEVIPNADAPNAAKDKAQSQVDESLASIEEGRQIAEKEIIRTADETEAAVRADEKAIAEDLGASQARVNALRQTADDAQGTTADTPITSDVSKSLAEDLNTIDKYDKRAESRAWAVIDDAGSIDVSKAATNMDSYSATLKLPPTDAAAIQAAFKPEFARIKSWTKAKVEPKEIQSVLRDMKQKIADNAADGSPDYAHTSAKKMVRYLEDQLTDTNVTQGFDGFREAIASTVKRHYRTKSEKVGNARRKSPDETLARNIGYKGDDGATTARVLKQAESPVMLEKSHDFVRSEANRLAKSETGELSEDFMAEYDGYLTAFPKLKAEIQSIADANKAANVGADAGKVIEADLASSNKLAERARQDGAKKMEADLKDLKTRSTNAEGKVKKGAMASFANDVEGTLQKILDKPKAGSKANTNDMTELHNWAIEKGVSESFRAKVKEQVLAKLFPEVDGSKLINAKSLQKFKDVSDTLVDSGVLTRAEADNVEKTLRTNATNQKGRKGAGVVGLTPTVTTKQKLSATALSLFVVASTGMPHALLATRLVRDMIENEMKRQNLTPESIKMVGEFMVNPEKYQKAHKALLKAREKGGKLDQEKAADMVRLIVAGEKTIN